MKTFESMAHTRRLRNLLFSTAMAMIIVACSSNNNPPPPAPPPPPPPPAAIAISGVVTDGPVTGGTLFLFAADQVQAALVSVDPAGDRLADLSAAASLLSLTRDAADEDQYTLEVPAGAAETPVFLVFDNTNAEDDAFKDTPANLESVVMLGAAGGTQRVNVSMQTTLIAQQVRVALDPDGDGTNIIDAEIADAIDAATANVISAFATDSLGRDLYPADFDPIASSDDDVVHAASSAIGFLLHAAGHLQDVGFDAVVAALSADAADGLHDGSIPVSYAPTPEQEALAAAVSDVASAGSDEDIAVFAVGPCSSAAVSLQQACAVDVMDDIFETTAVCMDTLDDDDRAGCLADVQDERAENEDECDTVFDARLSLCEDVGDAAHQPLFGAAFAANFVNPLHIGNTVAVNPWFPLATGNRWVYEGDGETIDVEVTDEVKLIDGISCVVVIDTATEDDVVVEITRDWYAQDTSGNVWYCGEIARNFEVFEGDDPEDPELVDIEGSWKAGRDGAEAGILLPFDPQVGAFERQEVLYGEAEDAIEILAVDASESAPGGECAATCLQTRDFSPLDAEANENKFYVPGTGLIVEIDMNTGDRVELIEFTQAAAQ